LPPPLRVSHVATLSFPACRLQYPGGRPGPRSVPGTRSCCLPRFGGGSASTYCTFEACSEFTRVTARRFAARLSRTPFREASAGRSPGGCFLGCSRSYRGVPSTPRAGLPPARQGHLHGAHRICTSGSCPRNAQCLDLARIALRRPGNVRRKTTFQSIGVQCRLAVPWRPWPLCVLA